MSRKRRHGPPARHQQQPALAPRHAVSPDAKYVARERVGGPSDASPATVVLRDGDGRPYVVLADGAGGAAYAQGAWQTQQAAAQSAQAMQVRSSSTGMTAGAAKPYPAMPHISDAKPLLRSLGATGTSIFSGIITSEEYNADFYWKDAIQIYEQMIRNDAQIFAVVQLLELPIRRATWSIEPGGDTPRDKEIAAFVETCLLHDQMRYTTSEERTLTQKWDDILRHILMMLRFGFMAFEVNWRLDDGWVKWARWTPLLPRTVWRWWVGEDNELVGIQQWTFKNYTYQFVDIPADKLLLFVHRQEGNNYEGVSILRSAYKHWYYKDNYYKIEAIDIERNAADIPAIYLPENFTQDDLNQAQTIMANMRVNEEMGVTMPPGWKIEYIRTYGRNTASIQPSIEHHDTMIARNVLGQFINLGSHEVGSYALASDQKATLLAALQAECEYIEDVINNDAIVRLVDYNFDGVEQYPRLKASKLIAQDLDVISTALNKLTSAPSGPLIHSDPELEDYLRDLYGLPKAPSGVVAGTNPTAPSTPERPETEAAQATAGNDHADAESKDAQPTARQQATSQAIANGAPGVSGRAAAGGAAVQTAEALRGPLREEARLLREALAAAVGADAVERGLQFFNPNHYPGGSRQGGQFAPRGGGGGGGGIGEGVSAARGSGGGARGRTSSASARGRSGAAHHGGSGGSGGGSGSKTKGEGETKAAKPRAPRKPKGEATAEKATTPKAPTESIHERAARLQREGGLAREVRPGEETNLKVTGEFGASRLRPTGTMDAEALRNAFGEEHVGSILHNQTMEDLRATARQAGMEAPLPRGKAELVTAITAHVTEGRYSADFGASGGKAKGEAKSEGSARSRARAGAKASKSEEEATANTTTAKSAREAELERQVAALRSENEALKAGGGARAAKTGEESGAKAKSAGWSEKNAEALRGPTPEPRNVHWSTYSPSAKFDPYRRVEQYGKDQLRAVLVRATQTRLREAARIVMGRNPGTKPKSLSSNDSMVNYIMEQVAPDY